MLIYLTTKFDITQMSFQVHPVNWNVSMLGETDRECTERLPGYSKDNQGRDTWTVELSIDNGRIHNWPHGITAEVSLYDEEGVYLLEDKEGNSITYRGTPPECLKILDDTDLSFSISENGYIEGWKMSIDLLKEWGTIATLTQEIQ